MQNTIPGLLFAAVVLIGGSVAAQEDVHDGFIELTGGRVAAGIGWNWGSGTLYYDGEAYALDVSGLSIAAVGITSVEASGEVYNLNDISEFNGNYSVARAGATVVAGVCSPTTTVSRFTSPRHLRD